MNNDDIITWLKTQRKLYKTSIRDNNPDKVFELGYRNSPLYITGKIDMIDAMIDKLKSDKQNTETNTQYSSSHE